MPNTHIFRVVDVQSQDGMVTVEWDGQPGRCMTCSIPLDETGAVKTGAAFASDILNACRHRLTMWDKLATTDKSVLETLIGQEFDVTDEYVLGGL